MLKTSRSAINYPNVDPAQDLDPIIIFVFTKALSSLRIRSCLFLNMTLPNRLHVDTHEQSHLSKFIEISTIYCSASRISFSLFFFSFVFFFFGYIYIFIYRSIQYLQFNSIEILIADRACSVKC